MPLPLVEQGLGSLGASGIFVSHFLEELGKFYVACPFSILYVLVLHLSVFGGVEKHAGEVVDIIAYLRYLFVLAHLLLPFV